MGSDGIFADGPSAVPVTLRVTELIEFAMEEGAKKVRDEAKQIIEALLTDYVNAPPDSDCSCHISPPCEDCCDYSHIKNAIEQANEFIKCGEIE